MPRYQTPIRIDGEKLRTLRGKRTLSEVAEIIGASPSAVQNWEKGRGIGSLHFIALLLLYGVTDVRCVVQEDTLEQIHRRQASGRLSPVASGSK